MARRWLSYLDDSLRAALVYAALALVASLVALSAAPAATRAADVVLLDGMHRQDLD